MSEKMEREDFDIAKLFAGYLAGNLTAEQQSELDGWLEASEDNRRLFERVCRGETVAELNRMAGRYHREDAWRKLEKELRAQKGVTLRRWRLWAAVLVLPLCLSYFLLHRMGGEPEQAETVAVGQPGVPKAVLTLADGSVVELKGDDEFELKELDGTRINKDSAMLAYVQGSDSPVGSAQPVYNRVDIPRGGEYSLILSDGTVVYLNAMSSLRFPVSFGGDTREVELTGEAWFQVAKDTAHPFIVRTGEIRVQVLGTQFNISSYPEDAAVRTTLVEGSVRVSEGRGHESVVIRPSQQAVFCKSSGVLEVEEVDVSPFIAWKNGKFDFRDWRLEDIMVYLSRWYKIDVFYQREELKDMRFGCHINRYSEIGPILEFLESTGRVKATLKGNTVVLSEAQSEK